MMISLLGESMQPQLRTTALIAANEFKQLITARHGILYWAAFALLWYLLLRIVVFNYSNISAGSEGGAEVWANTAFNTFFRIGLFVFPLLAILSSADQTCVDRVRGTLRFIHLRASRDSVFFGRFIAHLALQYLLIILVSIACAVMAAINAGEALAITQLLLLYVGNLLLAILPFVALMALLSVVLSSPRKASVLAVMIWALAIMLIEWLAEKFPPVATLKLLMPSMQFDELTKLEGVAMFSLAYIPLLQAAVLLFAGRFFMQRASL
jgi:ABC-type transport system involved in multi-copper enzyme maturation permease subunit